MDTVTTDTARDIARRQNVYRVRLRQDVDATFVDHRAVALDNWQTAGPLVCRHEYRPAISWRASKSHK
jgi:hypothetical protein